MASTHQIFTARHGVTQDAYCFPEGVVAGGEGEPLTVQKPLNCNRLGEKSGKKPPRKKSLVRRKDFIW